MFHDGRACPSLNSALQRFAIVTLLLLQLLVLLSKVLSDLTIAESTASRIDALLGPFLIFPALFCCKVCQSLLRHAVLLNKALTLGFAASPSRQLLLSEGSVVPLLVFERLMVGGPDVRLCLNLFTLDIAFTSGFVAFALQQTHTHGLEFVLAALEHVQTVDIAVGEAGNVGATDRVAFLRNDAGVIAVLDARALVVVEDGGGLSDCLDVVSADCGGAEDDVEEDFFCHQGACLRYTCQTSEDIQGCSDDLP
jgi:hypothetical protein